MLDGKHILITGGTGTLGHALVKLLAMEHKPARVIVLSRDEFKQAEMRREFPDVRYFIGDVRDLDRLMMAFNQVDMVVHTAAMKRIETCEFDPFEALLTNVGGTTNVVKAAMRCSVKRVVNISTDKAIAPANMYGHTKGLAEQLVTQANIYGKTDTRFANVRLGNLISSRGSVIQVWREAAQNNGVVSITGPDVRRFWVTVEDAAQLILHALEDMRGGEVYVPQCGVMTMLEIANIVAPNTRCVVIGPRPGDRSEDELMTADECGRAIFVRTGAESSFTIEDGHYIIPPLSVKHDDWTERGVAMRQGFTYRTETWTRRATREEILGNALHENQAPQ